MVCRCALISSSSFPLYMPSFYITGMVSLKSVSVILKRKEESQYFQLMLEWELGIWAGMLLLTSSCDVKHNY